MSIVLDKDHPVQIIDFGRDGTGGHLVFDVLGFCPGTIIAFSYSSHPDGLSEDGDFTFETRATYLGDDFILPILPASATRRDDFEINRNGKYEAPLLQGLLRYARITLKGGKSSFAEIGSLHFENRGTYATEPVTGEFNSSCGLLNRIWRSGMRTTALAAVPARDEPLTVTSRGGKACLGRSLPYLSDGAKRDRLVWSGDLWWGAINLFYGFSAAVPYLSGSLRMLAANQTPKGYIPACPRPETAPPPEAEDYGPFPSDEFAAWFIPAVYENHLYRGDDGLLKELLPAMERLMDYLVSHSCPENGLFEQRPETAKNAGALRFGEDSLHHRAYMNVLLLSCLEIMSSLSERGEYFAALAARLKKTIQKLFLLEGGGLAFSLESPAFSGEATALWHTLVESERGRYPYGKYSQIWHGKFQALAIRAIFENGMADEAIEAIESHNWPKTAAPEWRGLATAYECMYPHTSGWGDEAHPDAAISGILSKYLLGVSPLSPGFKTFAFKPCKSGKISFCSGKVPTPHGTIEAYWRHEKGNWLVRVLSPDSISGKLLLPGFPPKDIPGGHFEGTFPG